MGRGCIAAEGIGEEQGGRQFSISQGVLKHNGNLRGYIEGGPEN